MENTTKNVETVKDIKLDDFKAPTSFGVPVKHNRKTRVSLTEAQKRQLVKEYDSLPENKRGKSKPKMQRLVKKYGFASYNTMYKAIQRYRTAIEMSDKAIFLNSDVPQGAVLKKHSAKDQLKKMIKEKDESMMQVLARAIITNRVDVNLKEEDGEIKIRF